MRFKIKNYEELKEKFIDAFFGISPAWGRALGFFVLAPLLAPLWGYLFHRGNTDALAYVDEYIQNSDTIRVVYPEDWYKDGVTETIFDVYHDQDHHKKCYIKEVFYSDSLKKYVAMILFKGVDFYDKEKRGGDLGAGREKSYFNEGNVFLVRVNRIQLHDPKYGTKENPVPVFWYKFVKGTTRNRVYADRTPYDPSRPTPYFLAQDTVTDEANKLFVTEYLTRFLPQEEIERLFGKKE
ncbi:immunoglobulin domain-containing family protein [Prevotella denticola]|uniref:enterotoxin n=1 Tax=Prevotella denticola TaxID=28129 RepID=UPI001FD11E83|nr:enterotoxin [Prevotella denticola]